MVALEKAAGSARFASEGHATESPLVSVYWVRVDTAISGEFGLSQRKREPGLDNTLAVSVFKA